MKREPHHLERDWMRDRVWRSSAWAQSRRKRLDQVFVRALSWPSLMADDAKVLAGEAIALARVSSAIEVSA